MWRGKMSCIVVGDVMLDRYMVSEAPPPTGAYPGGEIYQKMKYKETLLPGGAANVASLVSTGILGQVGRDAAGNALVGIMNGKMAPIYVKDRTTVKTRIFWPGGGLRYDEDMSAGPAEDLIIGLSIASADADVVVISDYNKGVVSRRLARVAINSKKKVVANVKPANLEHFRNAWVITMNQEEFGKVGMGMMDIVDSLDLKYLIVTAGDDGLYCAEEGADSIQHYGVKQVDVKNTVGAGDAVLAAVAINAGGKKLFPERVVEFAADYVSRPRGV